MNHFKHIAELIRCYGCKNKLTYEIKEPRIFSCFCGISVYNPKSMWIYFLYDAQNKTCYIEDYYDDMDAIIINIKHMHLQFDFEMSKSFIKKLIENPKIIELLETFQ